MTRILIAIDHNVVRSGLLTNPGGQWDCEAVVEDGRRAVAPVTRPDAAEILGVNPRTVKCRQVSIMRDVGVNAMVVPDRNQLVEP